MTIEIRSVRYRTSDGEEDYVFDFVRRLDGWRVYIVSSPSYGSRSTGSIETHRLTDGGRRFICWDRPLSTLDDAKSVAALWADATQAYRKTGTFNAPSDRSHVYDRSTSAHVHDVPFEAVPPARPPVPATPATPPAPRPAPARPPAPVRTPPQARPPAPGGSSTRPPVPRASTPPLDVRPSLAERIHGWLDWLRD